MEAEKKSAARPGVSAEAAIMAVFFIHAAATGGLFTRIPDFQVAQGLNEAELGLVLLAPTVGGLGSLLFSGPIVDRIGTRFVAAIGIPSLAFSSVLISIAPSPVLAVLALLLHGVSFSFVNVAMNVEADRIEAGGQSRIMNKCHGLWSLGFLFASLLGTAARGSQLTMTVHFIAVFVPILLVSTALYMVGHNAAPRAHAGSTKKKAFSFPTTMTLRLMGFGIVAGVVHGATNNWSVIYMRDTFTVADWVETLTIPAFLLTLFIGRMSGDYLTDKLGNRKLGYLLNLITLAGVLTVIFAANLTHALIGFALMGLGTSIMFPLMVSAAARVGDRPAAENVAAVTLATGLTLLAAPPLMGFVAEEFGLRAAYGIILPAIVVSLSMVRFLRATPQS